MRRNNKLIVIGGPTAAGKSELAAFVSRKIGGEIINADSMQVYKGLDIGTNKEIPHDIKSWLFDIVEPDSEFNISHYQIEANKAIKDIQNRDKVPVLVGGSGLYIDAVIKGYELAPIEPDSSLRERLKKLSISELKFEVSKRGLSLQSLNQSDKNNPHRLIRLIEKAETDRQYGPKKQNSPKHDVLFLYPEFDKEKLKMKIDERVSRMMDQGLVEEVEKLLYKGYTHNTKSLNSTGYKQVIEFLQGKIKTKEELVKRIATAHKQYAKRQITWFEGKGRGYDLHKVNKSNVLDVINNFLKTNHG